MRVLVLDDMEARHREFAQAFAADETVHVRTAAEAIAALDAGARFDLAQLDHDLSEDHYIAYHAGGDAGPGTGMDVVEHIASMPFDRRPRLVIVHSFNAPAAQRMVAALKAARIPSAHKPFRAAIREQR